ncbi:hypothetical protein FIBSPDRAFT_272592 [Athelia psychrophila]|uniref:Uncharacterized protein n=1 Tax=Athelia psychrophila TaxID=1759441 RepID=A0A165WT78_9AGAM|nr:hypothetical protein FIBSPDRAFT_272592 [Fibularhizoctonia sp. CBS 109695]
MYLPRAAGRGKRPAFPYHILQLQLALVQRAAMTIGPRCRALVSWRALCASRTMESDIHAPFPLCRNQKRCDNSCFQCTNTLPCCWTSDVKNIVAASRYIQEAFQQTRVGTATEVR